jgi:signal transduction histidine kinase
MMKIDVDGPGTGVNEAAARKAAARRVRASAGASSSANGRRGTGRLPNASRVARNPAPPAPAMQRRAPVGDDDDVLDALEQPRNGRRWWFQLVLIFGWWTLWGIFLAGQYLGLAATSGSPMTIADAASRAFFSAAVWSVITLITFALVRRFPLERPRPGHIAIHVISGAALAFGDVAASYVVGQVTGWLDGWPFVDHFFSGFPTNLFFYWLLVGVAHGIMFYERYRQGHADAVRLRARLAQAELHLLKSQLHPHFLFNTLHAISTLMHRDVRAADRMLARLSDLLRVALDYTGTQEVSLQEELEFLEPYLEIERARLGERLSFELDVPPDVLDARVPHMILQPLVENAIRHGIAPRVAPGHIRVSARPRRDMLDIDVSDDGVGMPNGRSLNGGLGLTITRARLEQLYGRNFRFDPHNTPEGGFRVSITIPFRPVGAAHHRSDDE